MYCKMIKRLENNELERWKKANVGGTEEKHKNLFKPQPRDQESVKVSGSRPRSQYRTS
jgi:hypothetical protein